MSPGSGRSSAGDAGMRGRRAGGGPRVDSRACIDLPRRKWLRQTARWLAIGFVAPPALAGCARALRSNADSVTVYTSVDDVLARTVLAQCEAATGVAISPLFDTEATKTTALEGRIRSERERPRADLFWSSEGFAVRRLARDGLLAPIPEGVWSAWPAPHRDPDRNWIAFAARARVVVTKVGDPSPTMWADLASPSLAARVQRPASTMIAVADPRFGTTGAHLAALDDAWRRAGDAGVEVPTLDAWLDGMRRNGVRVYQGGNAATVDAVARGECSFGLTDTDDALAAIARGLPISMSLPRSLPEGVSGGGTMLVPNTVAIVRSGPGQRDPVERVLAWLVSADSERLIADSPSRNLPLGPARSVDLPYAESDPLVFDALAASERAADLAVRAKARLEGSAALAAGVGR